MSGLFFNVEVELNWKVTQRWRFSGLCPDYSLHYKQLREVRAVFDEIRQLRPTDLAQLTRFYREVCAHQPADDYGPDWHWGVYPSTEMLATTLQTQKVMGGFIWGQLAVVGVLSCGEDPDYAHVSWPTQVPTEQVAVLHLYAVHPQFRGRGVASAMLQALLVTAREAGAQVVHLDVLAGNVAAEKLYVKNGFRLAENVVLHYRDIGDTPARMYEYGLQD